ncbi:hypothetical protein DL769_007882 [Monosporascus sp. CRB-8-3]|nr:hypothetical protein DL769_007882 [Monosporascus sp. CRB-8-3]
MAAVRGLWEKEFGQTQSTFTPTTKGKIQDSLTDDESTIGEAVDEVKEVGIDDPVLRLRGIHFELTLERIHGLGVEYAVWSKLKSSSEMAIRPTVRKLQIVTGENDAETSAAGSFTPL